MAGLPVTRSDIDLEVGSAFKNLNIAINKAADLDDGLKSRPDEELLALGYSQEDVDTIRGALADATLLYKIYRGNQALPTAQDFRKNAKDLWGLGM